METGKDGWQSHARRYPHFFLHPLRVLIPKVRPGRHVQYAGRSLVWWKKGGSKEGKKRKGQRARSGKDLI